MKKISIVMLMVSLMPIQAFALDKADCLKLDILHQIEDGKKASGPVASKKQSMDGPMTEEQLKQGKVVIEEATEEQKNSRLEAIKAVKKGCQKAFQDLELMIAEEQAK